MYGLRSAPSRRLHRQATAQNLTVPTLMLQHEMKESLDKRHGKTMEYDQQGSPRQAGLRIGGDPTHLTGFFRRHFATWNPERCDRGNNGERALMHELHATPSMNGNHPAAKMLQHRKTAQRLAKQFQPVRGAP
jgi:hypothetical protein